MNLVHIEPRQYVAPLVQFEPRQIVAPWCNLNLGNMPHYLRRGVMGFLTAILFLGLPRFAEPIAVDMIELNHSYDDKGKLMYSQVIAWDWCPQKKAYVVSQWWIVEKEDFSIVRRGDERVVQFSNRLSKRRICLRTRLYKESHTKVGQDPERLNRAILRDSERVPIIVD